MRCIAILKFSSRWKNGGQMYSLELEEDLTKNRRKACVNSAFRLQLCLKAFLFPPEVRLCIPAGRQVNCAESEKVN